jgi:methionine synthase I (cobalamin-dependent)
MGTRPQAAALSLDAFNNHEGCNEISNETSHDVMETKYVRLQSG